MTPFELDAAMNELCRTSNRDVLREKGLDLIRAALGNGADAYIPAIDQFCRRVRQLGNPVVPTKFSGASTQEGTNVL